MHYLLSFLLLLVSIEAMSQPRPYVHVGGPEQLKERLRVDGEGSYFRLYDLRAQDTVWAWVEHVTPERGPDYDSAKHADVVLWCFPQEHPHPDHILPNADGLIQIRRQQDILWVSER